MAKFRKKSVVIEAVCITQPMLVETETGIAKGRPGDWLIQEAFATNYEPEDDYSIKYLEEVNKRNKVGF